MLRLRITIPFDIFQISLKERGLNKDEIDTNESLQHFFILIFN